MCDTVVALPPSTAKRTILFGKNSDREYNEAQYLELVPAKRHEAGTRVRLTYIEIAQAPETHTVVLSRPHWIWGAEIGANEHGLVIGNEAIHARTEASLSPGVIGMDYLRLALERARGVEEGIETITTLLKQHGQSGKCGFTRDLAYDNSYLLADPNGASVLETVDREWAVRPITSYYAVSNAMTIDTIRSKHEEPSKSASGCFRRDRAMVLLGQRDGCLEVTDFFAVLRDHKEGPRPADRASGPRICAHTRENPLGQTTASWVAALMPGKRLHWVTGTAAPCTGLFKPVFLEAGLPEHGPPPGAEEDSQSLWWRHERLIRGMDKVQEVNRTAFLGERDALEVRFLERMNSCPAPQEDLREARRAVEACWREALEFESTWLSRVS